MSPLSKLNFQWWGWISTVLGSQGFRFFIGKVQSDTREREMWTLNIMGKDAQTHC